MNKIVTSHKPRSHFSPIIPPFESQGRLIKEIRETGAFLVVVQLLLAKQVNKGNVNLAFIKGVTIREFTGPLQYCFCIRPKSVTIVNRGWQ